MTLFTAVHARTHNLQMVNADKSKILLEQCFNTQTIKNHSDSILQQLIIINFLQT